MLAARKARGRPSNLDPKQKLKVRRWINGKDQRQWGFDFGLWTRKIVTELRRSSRYLPVCQEGKRQYVAVHAVSVMRAGPSVSPISR